MAARGPDRRRALDAEPSAVGARVAVVPASDAGRDDGQGPNARPVLLVAPAVYALTESEAWKDLRTYAAPAPRIGLDAVIVVVRPAVLVTRRPTLLLPVVVAAATGRLSKVRKPIPLHAVVSELEEIVPAFPDKPPNFRASILRPAQIIASAVNKTQNKRTGLNHQVPRRLSVVIALMIVVLRLRFVLAAALRIGGRLPVVPPERHTRAYDGLEKSSKQRIIVSLLRFADLLIVRLLRVLVLAAANTYQASHAALP